MNKIIVIEIVLIIASLIVGVGQKLFFPIREYVEHPAYSYPAAPKELEQAVGEFFSKKGDNSSFSFIALKHSDDIFLLKAETYKTVGWALIARKIQHINGTHWHIVEGTGDDFKDSEW
jgi:hypothetical protein